MNRPELRLVLAVSLDGRLAPPEGGAAQLGGAGDRRALEEALVWADACLIGAQTLRLHGSTCLIRQPELVAQRQADGRSAQPRAIVVSRSGRFAPDLPFWTQPLERWLLQAHGPEPAPRPQPDLPPPPGFSRLLCWSTWPEALAPLAAAGIQRLVVLGGAQLAASLLAADCLDALQLTLCPLLLGGPHHWLPSAGLPLHGQGWRLEQCRPLGGDEVLLRYRRTPAL